MRQGVRLLAGVVLLLGFAVTGHAEMTAQQSKMGECNKQAEGMKGDQRKTFMSTCLKKDKPTTQQDKMKQCNQQAGDKKGDERKAFMSTCLKKTPA